MTERYVRFDTNINSDGDYVKERAIFHDLVKELDTLGWMEFFISLTKRIDKIPNFDSNILNRICAILLCIPRILCYLSSYLLGPVVNSIDNVLKHYKTMLYQTGLYILLIISVDSSISIDTNIKIKIYIFIYIWLILGCFDYFFHIWQIWKLSKRECTKKIIDQLSFEYIPSKDGPYYLLSSEQKNCSHLRIGDSIEDGEQIVLKLQKGDPFFCFDFIRVKQWGYKLWFADYRSAKLSGDRVSNDFYESKWGDMEYLYHHFNGYEAKLHAMNAFKIFISKTMGFEMIKFSKVSYMTNKEWLMIQTKYKDWFMHRKLNFKNVHFDKRYVLKREELDLLEDIHNFISTTISTPRLVTEKEELVPVKTVKEVEIVEKSMDVVNINIEYPAEVYRRVLRINKEGETNRRNHLTELIREFNISWNKAPSLFRKKINGQIKNYNKIDPEWLGKKSISLVTEVETKKVEIKESVEYKIKKVAISDTSKLVYTMNNFHIDDKLIVKRMFENNPTNRFKGEYGAVRKARKKLRNYKKIYFQSSFPDYDTLVKKKELYRERRDKFFNDYKSEFDKYREKFNNSMDPARYRWDLFTNDFEMFLQKLSAVAIVSYNSWRLYHYSMGETRLKVFSPDKKARGALCLHVRGCRLSKRESQSTSLKIC